MQSFAYNIKNTASKLYENTKKKAFPTGSQNLSDWIKSKISIGVRVLKDGLESFGFHAG